MDERQRIGRRTFVKGAVGGIGVAAIGVAAQHQAAAKPATRPTSSLDGQLRAVTWTGRNSAFGLVSAGTDAVRIRPLALENNQLRVSGEDLARLPTGRGPVAIGAVPGSTGSILVTTTTIETVAQYDVSFELDSTLRQYFLDEGIELDGFQTEGDMTFDIQQVVPEPVVVSTNGAITTSRGLSSGWKDVLVQAHFEPISIHNMNNSWTVFLLSSGAHGLEASIPGNIIAVTLSASDATITDVQSIGKIDRHSIRGFRVVELGKTRVAFLSALGSEMIQVNCYDLATKEVKSDQFRPSDLPNSKRILQHDRLTASGRPNSWVVELLPGTYSLETTEGEQLWRA